MERDVREMDVSTLARGLTGAGVPLATLRGTTCQVVLFGSRAAGVAGPGSDWDVLCIGRAPCSQQDIRGVDLVWLEESSLGSASWLESELAGHVARYGVWLHGEPDWVSAVRCGPAAAERKARRISSRLRALKSAWPLLSPAHQVECATLLRRDIRRHELLIRGEPVPPSWFLDNASAPASPATGQFAAHIHSLFA